MIPSRAYRPITDERWGVSVDGASPQQKDGGTGVGWITKSSMETLMWLGLVKNALLLDNSNLYTKSHWHIVYLYYKILIINNIT